MRDVGREAGKAIEGRGIRVMDRSGREWQPRAYSTMAVRTGVVDTHNAGNLAVAEQLGSPGVRVSDGGPGDVDEPCIIANGQHWSLAYANTHRLEHPQCRRSFAALPSYWAGEFDRGGDEPEPEPEPEAIRRLREAVARQRDQVAPEPETDRAALNAAYDDLSALGDNEPAVREALDAIAGIHRTDELEQVRLRVNSRMKSDGSYDGGDSREQPTVELNPRAATPGVDAAHELGHWVDHKGFGQPSGFGSGSQRQDAVPELRALRVALEHSEGYAELIRLRARYKQVRKGINYLLLPKELFARAYAQYIALRSGNEDMLREIAERRDKTIPHQWQDDDFEPIAAEFDRIFEDKGWRFG